MHKYKCARCNGRFSSTDAQPWCPRCGSHEVVRAEESSEEWIRIIVTMLVILGFFVLFAGLDEIAGMATWFKTGR